MLYPFRYRRLVERLFHNHSISSAIRIVPSPLLPVPPILEVRGLTKIYNGTTVVDNLSFSVSPGEVYGFLGENGAGKSTTLRMALGLVHPTAGEVRIGGEVLTPTRKRLLRRIGAVVERPDLYGYLSGWDNLRFFAALSAKDVSQKHLHDILELVGLTGQGAKKVKAYSQGMKQRLGIAIALAHDPELLILDEPTNGLDPQGIAEMRALILHLSRERGKTILVSSHLLTEIEQTATRMIIIHRGKKMVEGRVNELLAPAETVTEVLLEGADEALQSALRVSAWAEHTEYTSSYKLLFKMHPSRVPELAAWLVAAGARIRQIRSAHSLETFFLSLTDDTAAAHRAV